MTKSGGEKNSLCYGLQGQRQDILYHLIQRRPFLSEKTLRTLDFRAVAKETEGFTAQDLALLLERATHANMIQVGHSDQGIKRL